MGLHYIYAIIIKIRNLLFDMGWRPLRDCGVPVISVGNITVGGTGKTPVIIEMASILKGNHNIGIVSRGYKGLFKGAQLVDLSVKNPGQYFGDEPTLIAKKTNSPVAVCSKRIEACLKLKNQGVDTILADDCFQHRSLKRDLDIVLLDATEEAKNYRPLPLGRMREPFLALRRAQVIIITKRNLLPKNDLPQWDLWFQEMINKNKITSNILEGNYIIDRIENFTGEEINSKERFMLLSAIAKPLAFERLLSVNSIEVVKHITYRDHYNYTFKDVSSIQNKARDLSVKILVTEKDRVKLEVLDIDKNLFGVVKLKIDFSAYKQFGDKEKFNETLINMGS